MATQRNVSFNLDALFSPYPAGKDFFDATMDVQPAAPLRNTTDDLSIKYLEASDCVTTGGWGSHLGYPERRMHAGPNDSAANSSAYQQQQPGKKSLTRSFSLIMEAYEQDSMMTNATTNAPSSQQQRATWQTAPDLRIPQDHMAILMNSDAPPPSIRELYSKYQTGNSSNLASFLQGGPAAPQHHQHQSKIPKIPAKQVDQLMKSLREEKNAAKRASAQAEGRSKRQKQQQQAVDMALDQPFQAQSGGNCSDMLNASYERSISIGTRILHALDRTNVDNASQARERKLNRQKARAQKASKGAGTELLPPMSMTVSPDLSSQMYVDMEILVRHTKLVITENESLKENLAKLSRTSLDQAATIEDKQRGLGIKTEPR